MKIFSTNKLNTLLYLHTKPIYVIVSNHHKKESVLGTFSYLENYQQFYKLYVASRQCY